MDDNALDYYRQMAESAKNDRILMLQDRVTELRAQLDDAHAKLFGSNFWLLVIGIAIGVVSMTLVGGVK